MLEDIYHCLSTHKKTPEIAPEIDGILLIENLKQAADLMEVVDLTDISDAAVNIPKKQKSPGK
jgi:hypothetical protein